MRIVAIADTHTFQHDLAPLPDGDVFVHAGDMLRAGTLEELTDVAAWIRRLPYRHKVIVAGNHDGCFASTPGSAVAQLGDAIYLQDAEATIDSLRFWGSPWQPAYGSWSFNLSRGEALAEKWKLIPEGVDVLVTHGPPRGYGDRGPVEGRAGCEDLLRRVREVRPRLHLFGHIHQDGGIWRDGSTTFANVTTWECERAATVLDVDPSTKNVVEVFVPPSRAIGR